MSIWNLLYAVWYRSSIFDEISVYRGLRASQCEIKYLDLVSRQSVYGVQLYNVKVREKPFNPSTFVDGLSWSGYSLCFYCCNHQGVPDNLDYQLGISPHGLAQHDGKTRLALFSWPLIDSINFKRRELRITVRSKQVNQFFVSSISWSMRTLLKADPRISGFSVLRSICVKRENSVRGWNCQAKLQTGLIWNLCLQNFSCPWLADP